MIPRNRPATSSPPSNPGFPGDFQVLCSFAMDQALGIEEASLSTAFVLNSYAIDICKNAFWFAPIVGNLLDMAAQSVACSMELQKNWLTLLAPHALLHPATPHSRVASTSGGQAQPTAEELACSMDIAIGARLIAPSSSDNQAHSIEEVPENDMDIAIGARA